MTRHLSVPHSKPRAARRSPSRARGAAEIRRLKELAAQRDAAALDQIAFWNSGGPIYRENEIAINMDDLVPPGDPIRLVARILSVPYH
jgi:hypothetical protein